MRISAKDLGWLAVDDFCPRCFWIERHANGLPYQMGFPGIFSSIDAYTKNIVERYVENNKELPKWLSSIGDIKRIISIKPSEFKTERGGVTLSGMPDLMFERHDGSFAIVDYKTAKYTGNQDALMPVYQIQLNGYAYIAEAIGYRPVRDLYLVYFEPPYRETYDAITDGHTNEDGFDMPFRPVIHRIKKDAAEIDVLLGKANRTYELNRPPKGLAGCKDCKRLEDLIGMVSNGS